MAFNEKHDFDDVWIRDILIGLLVVLNDKVTIKSDQKDFKIPFYLNMANDERWLQDWFTDYKNCEGISTHTDGNTDGFPRGAITMDSVTINSSAITNNFTRGYFTRENDEGFLEFFSAEMLSMPFTMSLNITVKCSHLMESYKVFQEIVKTFYSTEVFNTTHNGFLIQSRVGFPEDYTIDSQFEFGYDEKEQEQIEFPLEIECYMPVVDESTIMSVSSGVIEKLRVDIYLYRASVENLLRTFNIPK